MNREAHNAIAGLIVGPIVFIILAIVEQWGSLVPRASLPGILIMTFFLYILLAAPFYMVLLLIQYVWFRYAFRALSRGARIQSFILSALVALALWRLGVLITLAGPLTSRLFAVLLVSLFAFMLVFIPPTADSDSAAMH